MAISLTRNEYIYRLIIYFYYCRCWVVYKVLFQFNFLQNYYENIVIRFYRLSCIPANIGEYWQNNNVIKRLKIIISWKIFFKVKKSTIGSDKSFLPKPRYIQSFSTFISFERFHSIKDRRKNVIRKNCETNKIYIFDQKNFETSMHVSIFHFLYLLYNIV